MGANLTSAMLNKQPAEETLCLGVLSAVPGVSKQSGLCNRARWLFRIIEDNGGNYLRNLTSANLYLGWCWPPHFIKWRFSSGLSV